MNITEIDTAAHTDEAYHFTVTMIDTAYAAVAALRATDNPDAGPLNTAAKAAHKALEDESYVVALILARTLRVLLIHTGQHTDAELPNC